MVHPRFLEMVTAIEGGHTNAVQHLLDEGMTVKSKIKEDMTPLHVAAQAGQEDIVRLLLAQGAKPNVPCMADGKQSSLHYAVAGRHVGAARVLLENGANIIDKRQDGQTALHIAAASGCAEMVTLLMAFGANPATKEVGGYTAQQLAVRSGHMDLVALLDKREHPRQWEVPEAIASGDVGLLQELLDGGVSHVAVYQDGKTALHLAVDAGQTEIAEMLLLKKLNPNIACKINSYSALHLAAQRGNLPMVQLLLQHSAAVNQVAKGNMTALHIAAFKGHWSIAYQLLRAGAIINPNEPTKGEQCYRAIVDSGQPWVEWLVTTDKGVILDESSQPRLQTQPPSPGPSTVDSIHTTNGNTTTHPIPLTPTPAPVPSIFCTPTPPPSSTPTHPPAPTKRVTPIKSSPTRAPAQSSGSHQMAANPVSAKTQPPTVPMSTLQPPPWVPWPGSGQGIPKNRLEKMMKKVDLAKREVVLIDSNGRVLEEAIEHMFRCLLLTLDAEGFSPTGPSLLQVAAVGVDLLLPERTTDTIYVYLFDLRCNDSKAIMQALAPVLGGKTPMKAIHDLHQDAWQLAMAHHVPLSGVFDTQLAHELATGEVFGGLGKLVSRYTDLSHASKRDTQNAMDADPDLWAHRPIDPALIEYASDDVALLLAVFAQLWTKLDQAQLASVLNASQERCDRAMACTSELTASQRPMVCRGDQWRLSSTELTNHVANMKIGGPVKRRVEMDTKSIGEFLPQPFRDLIAKNRRAESIQEIGIELGRPPVITYRCSDGETEMVVMEGPGDMTFTQKHMDGAIKALGSRLGSNNRVTLDGSLHRVSAVRMGDVVCGLTIFPGRSIMGAADAGANLFFDSRKSVLVVGPRGSGKTTFLREAARLLSQLVKKGAKSVFVVDTLGAVCGYGTVLPPAVGLARRMPVEDPLKQNAVISECVQNHHPHTIVIDEISPNSDVDAVRAAISMRVQVLAGVQGTFRDLCLSPELCELVKARPVPQQTGPQTSTQQPLPPPPRPQSLFGAVVELLPGSPNRCRVIVDPLRASEDLMAGRPYRAQVREIDADTGRMIVYWVPVDQYGVELPMR